MHDKSPRRTTDRTRCGMSAMTEQDTTKSFYDMCNGRQLMLIRRLISHGVTEQQIGDICTIAE